MRLIGCTHLVESTGGGNVSQTYTAVIQEDGEWWVGWVKEVRGVNAQERTREELLNSLRYALEDMLNLNETDALDAASAGYEEVEIAV